MLSKPKKFVMCIKNDHCEDIEPRKVYEVLPDSNASRNGYLRVVDESGEDYVYPESYFVPVPLSAAAQEAILFGR
jgi:hypothetical protein